MSSGRLVGIILIGSGVALALIGVLWLVAGIQAGRLESGGAVLGGGILAVILLPVVGAGAFLLVRSSREAQADAERAQLRRILDIVASRGQVPVTDLALELGLPRERVQNAIHALVGMGLFSGFINWDEGVLYSEAASGLRQLERCRHCGGELKLAGKGIIACPYCGTEYFLT